MTRTIACPSCGKQLQQFGSDSLSLTCSLCGKLINLSNYECTAVKGRPFPPSPLAIGDIGQLLQKKWQIVGRALYEGSVSEFDYEDSEFCTEPWQYVTWNLISTDGAWIYITEDAEGYTIAEALPVTRYQKKSHREVVYNGKSKLIEAFGLVWLKAMQGEFSWVPTMDEITDYFELQDDQGRVSVDARRVPEESSYREIEFFRIRSIDRAVLLNDFGKKAILESEQVQKEEISSWSNCYLWLGVLLLLIAIMTSFFGSTVMTEKFQLSDVPVEGKLVGPFTLSSTHRVHEIGLNVTGMPRNTWVGGSITLLDNEQSPLSADEKEFWHETGYDDGNWEESDERLSKIFTLSEPGQYFAEIEIDPESSAKSGARGEFYIKENVFAIRYLLVGAFLLIALGLTVRYYKTANPLYIVVGVFGIVHFLFTRYRESEWDD